MSILLSELSSDPRKNHNISGPTGAPTGGLFRTKIEFIYMINNKIVLLKVGFVGHKRTTLNGGWWWGRWDSNPHTEGART